MHFNSISQPILFFTILLFHNQSYFYSRMRICKHKNKQDWKMSKNVMKVIRKLFRNLEINDIRKQRTYEILIKKISNSKM